MKLFLDTADLKEIEKWLALGLIEGVTTNPTLLKRAGFKNPEEAWKKIIELKSRYTEKPISLSAEVFCDEAERMLEQARSFVAKLAYAGLAIKIPILGTDGTDRLSVIRSLSEEGIAVNCTGCVTWIQTCAAAVAGARFVSLLYRRSIDAKLNGLIMIRRTREFLDSRNLKAEIIVGSIREANDVFDAFEAGAHIVTVPPKFMLFHQKSVDTQIQFLTDAGVFPEKK